MKLGIVVQRYGADIGGGSELHARYIAEHLASHADVTVLTTCARDYVTWRNEYPPGRSDVNGIAVERFPVAHERDLRDFARRSSFVFQNEHSVHDELGWLDAQGPVCPALVAHIEHHGRSFDYLVAFSIRYYTAFHAARVASDRTVIVPTTERDPVLGCAVIGAALRGARAIMYNTPEERALIESVAGTGGVPGVTVGVGSRVPATASADRARATFDLRHPFIVYVGRIDANKGCEELFDYFSRYRARTDRAVDLVLIGSAVLPVPQAPGIRHLGYVSDGDKFDVIAAAEALVMPSPLESLSMVALEAWALGRPVLANGRCDVLVGQCLRSNGGLYYSSAREFEEMLETIVDDPALASRLGRNGQAYYHSNYDWPIIERKYLEMFDALGQAPSPARAGRGGSPGWLEKRRRHLAPAARVVEAAPGGPVGPLHDMLEQPS